MELWEEIRADRETGARLLVAAYKDRLYSAAFMMCADAQEAEDLVFRTFAQAIRKIGKYRPDGSFYNWVFTILVNFRRMDVRKKKSRIAMLFPEKLPEVPDPGPNAADRLSLSVDAARVRAAVAKLPDSLRLIVVLRYFEDLPTPDIARLAKIPEGTVRSRLHYAKDLLYSYLN